ncbi:MAG: DUF148 domain-containing protein [Azoarcus sp.]|nr:DUF148 domain-containing protein [Azoarcus sp.]
MIDLTTAIGASITGYSVLRDAFSAFISARDSEKAAKLEREFSEKLASALNNLLQVQQAALVTNQVLAEQHEEIRALKAQMIDKSRYVLRKLGTQGEYFAYCFVPPTETVYGTGDDPHFVCQPCFDAGTKSVLHGLGSGIWRCSVCKTSMHTEPISHPPRRSYDPFEGIP